MANRTEPRTRGSVIRYIVVAAIALWLTGWMSKGMLHYQAYALR